MVGLDLSSGADCGTERILWHQVLEWWVQKHESKEDANEVGPKAPLLIGDSVHEARSRIKEEMQNFTDEAPFSIQRICELLVEPTRHYNTLAAWYAPDRIPTPFLRLLLRIGSLFFSTGCLHWRSRPWSRQRCSHTLGSLRTSLSLGVGLYMIVLFVESSSVHYALLYNGLHSCILQDEGACKYYAELSRPATCVQSSGTLQVSNQPPRSWG